MSTTKSTIRPAGAGDLLATIAMYSDGGDEWGSNMGWYFAIAHVLWHRTAEPIPAAWEYRHSDACRELDLDDSYEQAEIMGLFPALTIEYPDEQAITWAAYRDACDTLLYVGTIVSRYDDWLRLAGRNY